MNYIQVPTGKKQNKMKKTFEVCEASEFVLTAFLEACWELWIERNYCKVDAECIRKVLRQYVTDKMEVYLQGSVLVQVDAVINVLLEG